MRKEKGQEQAPKPGLSKEQRKTLQAGFRFNSSLPTDVLRSSQIAFNAFNKTSSNTNNG